jgi:hypothetical protein
VNNIQFLDHLSKGFGQRELGEAAASTSMVVSTLLCFH